MKTPRNAVEYTNITKELLAGGCGDWNNTQGLKMTDLENTAFAPYSHAWFRGMKMAITYCL